MASNEFLLEYLPVLIFIFIASAVSLAMFLASIIAGRSKPDAEKLSAYECGFDAFSDAHSKFDVRYYLVAILFIIFDLEIAFLSCNCFKTCNRHPKITIKHAL